MAFWPLWYPPSWLSCFPSCSHRPLWHTAMSLSKCKSDHVILLLKTLSFYFPPNKILSHYSDIRGPMWVCFACFAVAITYLFLQCTVAHHEPSFCWNTQHLFFLWDFYICSLFLEDSSLGLCMAVIIHVFPAMLPQKRLSMLSYLK